MHAIYPISYFIKNRADNNIFIIKIYENTTNIIFLGKYIQFIVLQEINMNEGRP